MKNKFLIFLLILISISLTGCNKTSKEDKTSLKIGITMYDEYDPFTTAFANSIVDIAKKKGTENGINVTCNLVYSNKSQLQQNEQVDDFINSGYDVICVNLVDRTDATYIIDKAKSNDIPIIFINRELVNEDLERWDKLFYVGADPSESGRYQAKIITDILLDKDSFKECDFNSDGVIQYVMLEGEAGHQDAMVRTKISVEEIQNSGIKLEKISDKIVNWNREQSKTKMLSILTSTNENIELVIANDDNIALGALDALEVSNVSKLPLIVGVNGEKEVIENIMVGKIQGTVYNDCYTMGDITARMAISLGLDGVLPDDIVPVSDKYIYVPYEKIDHNNAKEYLQRAIN